MHDFLLAKEIIDSVLMIAEEKKLENIKAVFLEIGEGSLPHEHHHENSCDDCDHDHDEHLEELNISNVSFGLENISKDTILRDTEFKISKVPGNSWKITGMEV